jgi:hypothetical protein
VAAIRLGGMETDPSLAVDDVDREPMRKTPLDKSRICGLVKEGDFVPPLKHQSDNFRRLGFVYRHSGASLDDVEWQPCASMCTCTQSGSTLVRHHEL